MTDTIAMGEEFLAHHGVLGMHWGVRKPDETTNKTATSDDKHLTDAHRKALIGTGVAVGVGALAVAGLLAGRKISTIRTIGKDLVDDLAKAPKFKEAKASGERFADTMKDRTLPKGTVFHRVAAELEKDISSPKYTSYVDKDVLKYRKSWQTMSAKEGAKSFKTKFEAMEDAKIASDGTMKQIALEILDQKAANGSTLREVAHARALRYTYNEREAAQATARFLERTPKQIADDLVRGSAGGPWDDPVEKHLLKELTSRGYHGFTDTADSNLMASHAVVLIDDAVFKTSGSVLTKAERAAAQKAYNRIFKP